MSEKTRRGDAKRPGKQPAKSPGKGRGESGGKTATAASRKPQGEKAKGEKAKGGKGASASTDSLNRYRSKRHFDRTAEPSGETGVERPSEDGAPRFVVQIHDASTMHFDFRLESEGVLKSWSVPKGPSPDPHEKRLAMPTEDHPLDYRDFEGVIAPGEYGAGTVIVWDEGTYRPLSKDFPEALRRGHATFWLDGSKLRGGYALTRFRGSGDEGREAWLLVKQNDERAVRDGRTPDPQRARSARTGRTLKQVAAEEGERTAG